MMKMECCGVDRHGDDGGSEGALHQLLRNNTRQPTSTSSIDTDHSRHHPQYLLYFDALTCLSLLTNNALFNNVYPFPSTVVCFGHATDIILWTL
jgi:hypothetical protein